MNVHIPAAILIMMCTSYSDALLFDHNIVQTKYGNLRGTSTHKGNTKVYEFLKVPYAKPPVGSLRFQKPQEPGSWHGTRDATSYGPVCTQHVLNTYTHIYPNSQTSEDCLFLNIYVPESARNSKKAVLVYIHGGGFYSKSANLYDGSNLAAAGDIIVVLINYRLGLFGFLSTEDHVAKGNYGLWDQVAALKWVKENIANFGGDATNVTIAGHSAGGYSVGLHLVSNHSVGLFNRAIAMSGSGLSPRAVTHGSQVFLRNVANYLKCGSLESASIVRCLRGKTAAEILAAHQHQVSVLSQTASFYLIPGPVVDGDFLTGYPAELIKNPSNGDFRKVSLMIGTNNAEGWLLKKKFKHFERTYHFSTDNGVPKDAFCNGILPAISRDYFNSSQTITNEICSKYSSSDITAQQQGIKAINMYGDMMYMAPAVQTLRYHANDTSSPFAYQFLFTHKPSFPVVSSRVHWVPGAQHGDECWFIFKIHYFNYTQPELHLLSQFGNYITNFVKYGNPNGKTNYGNSNIAPHWGHYTSHREYFMNINLKMTLHQHLYPDRMFFWLHDIHALHTPSTHNTMPKIPYIFG